jgi:tetratricopeptide (TPR) repeat protein
VVQCAEESRVPVGAPAFEAGRGIGSYRTPRRRNGNPDRALSALKASARGSWCENKMDKGGLQMTDGWFRRLSGAAAMALVLSALGPVTAMADEHEKAEQAEEAAPLDPKSIGSFAGAFLAARTADADRDLEDAVRFYSRALSFEPENTEIKQRLMLAHFSTGQFEEGLKLAEELKDDGTIERVTDLARAVEAFRNREYRKVEQLLDYEGINDLDRLLSGLMRAWAAYGRGDAEAALDIIDEQQGVQWYEIFVNFHGGAIATAAGLESEARQRYGAVITDQAGGGAAPDTYMRAVMELAALEARAGNQQRALDVISTGEAFSPGYAPLAALRQSIENGEEPPLKIKSATDGAAAVLQSIAAALNREGAEEIVSLYLQFARVLDPDDASTLVLLGELAENLGRPEKAIAYYERVPEDSPMRRIAQLQLGLNLADLDRLDEAKTHLKSLIEADPDDMRSYLAYGTVLSSAEEYKEMAETYDAAVARIEGEPERQHWNIFFQRGIAYERLKEWETAEPNFLKALELYPDQPQVLNYLGYSWIDMNMNLEEGMEMIEKAVEQRPNDGYIIDSLGWAHYRLGNYQKAVEELERAVELRPSDPTINDHLGDAYWRVGRKLEANFQWNRALTLDPPEEEVVAIREKIENGLPAEKPRATAEERSDSESERPKADADERSSLTAPAAPRAALLD